MQVRVRKLIGKALRKKVYIPLVVLYGAYALFTGLWLPQFVQTQAEQFITTKTGHHLTMDKPSFNPFIVNLHLSNLHLTQPEGKPLFGFREMDINLSLSSVVRFAAVFDAIRLDGAEVDVALLSDGGLNWTALIDSLGSKEPDPEKTVSEPPRLVIGHFELSDVQLNLADEKSNFKTRIAPIKLELNDISTLPDSEGNYSIHARTTMGADISWQGKMELNPVTVTGGLRIDNFNLTQLAPYLEQFMPGKPPEGRFDFATEYQLKHNGQQLGLTLSNLGFKFQNLQLDLGKSLPEVAIQSIEVKDGRYDQLANSLALGSLALSGSEIAMQHSSGKVKFFQLGKLSVENAQVNLARQSVSADRLSLDTGAVSAVRNKQGQIDLLTAVQDLSRAMATPPGKPDARVPVAKPWHYRVGKVDLDKFSVALQDESTSPAANLALNDIALHVDGVSDNFAASVPVRFSLSAPEGGTLEIAGKVAFSPMNVDMQVKLSELALKPVQPYLGSVAKLDLVSGQFSTEGHANYNKLGGKYKGNFALNNLRLLESDTGETFLAWNSLGTRELTVTQKMLGIPVLDIDHLESKLIIDKNKVMNISRIMNKNEAADGMPAKGAAAPAATVTNKEPAPAVAPAFITNVDRVRIRNSAMMFADHSLSLPFGTRIHHLRADIKGISSRPDSVAQLEVDGQVDDYGTMQANGQINLFNPTDQLDIKVLFGNIEMTRMTPYSTTFAGRKIESGKLSLDLAYNIKQHKLAGENKIIMDKLTLGKRIENSTASDLPLDLAIAILQDADGRIDLGLPVSGSLDDPKFSYGGIIWKVFINVMGKVVTSPFRLIGAMFDGGGGDGFDSIVFAAGEAELAPAEREKILQVAAALNKRPGLALTVHGVYADADKPALQNRQLRRALNLRVGQSDAIEIESSSLVTNNPKVQNALESLYSNRVGRSELSVLKDGFRQANPGQLEEGLGGKMFSALSGHAPDKHTLSEQEVAQLKGKNFYAVLYERLRESEIIEETSLQALAKSRGDYVMMALKNANAPQDRTSLSASAKVIAENNGVPVKLDLGAAPRPVAPAASTTQKMSLNAMGAES